MESNLVYYRRRAAEERLAAGTAAHPKVRETHAELAKRYELAVRMIETGEQRPILHLVSAA